MQAASLLSKLRFCPQPTLEGKDAARGDNCHDKGFLRGAVAVQESSLIPWTGLGSKHPPWSGQSKLCCGLPQHPCVALFAGTPCHPDPHLASLTHCHSRSSISSPSPENTGHPSPAPPAETPPSWPCRQQGPALAGPAQSICTGSWQPHTVSAEHTLGSEHRQHGVSRPSQHCCALIRAASAGPVPHRGVGSPHLEPAPPSSGIAHLPWQPPRAGVWEAQQCLQWSCGPAEPCLGSCRGSVSDGVGNGKGERESSLLGKWCHGTEQRLHYGCTVSHSSCITCLTEGFFLLSLCFCQMPLVCVLEKQQITTAQ